MAHILIIAHFPRLFLLGSLRDFPVFLIAIATAWRWDFPDFISVRMFSEITRRELPFFSGIQGLLSSQLLTLTIPTLLLRRR